MAAAARARDAAAWDARFTDGAASDVRKARAEQKVDTMLKKLDAVADEQEFAQQARERASEKVRGALHAWDDVGRLHAHLRVIRRQR
jgi:hypothetical protein